MGNIVVPVDDRLYSTLQIGSDAFPFFLSHDNLSSFFQGFVNWHKQTQIEISCIMEGSVKVCLLKEEHVLRAGEGFVILPHVLHSIQPIMGQPGKYFTLIFSPNLLTGFPGSFFEQAWYAPVIASGKAFHAIPRCACDIMKLLHDIHALEAAHEGNVQLDIQRLLQDVWILLASRMTKETQTISSGGEERQILSMIRYLQEHYTQKFSLTEMAEYLHISRSQCCRYFKQTMGMTPTEYLTDYRLSKAAEYLTLTALSMTDIAFQTGFCSPSSFAAEFRKKTGQTPSEYRAAAQTPDGRGKRT